jgi:hypothetical protein
VRRRFLAQAGIRPRWRLLAASVSAVAQATALTLAGGGVAQAQPQYLQCLSSSNNICVAPGSHNSLALISSGTHQLVSYVHEVTWEGNKDTFWIENDTTGDCLDYSAITTGVYWESCEGTSSDPDTAEQFWADWPYLINWGATLDDTNVAAYLSTLNNSGILQCVNLDDDPTQFQWTPYEQMNATAKRATTRESTEGM